MFLAILSLQIGAIVPHHHHDDAVCVVMEKYQSDGHFNDRHTQHEPSGEEGKHDCVTEAHFVTPNTAKSLKVKNCVQDDLQHVGLPVFALIYYCFELTDAPVGTISTNDSYHPAHLSDGASCPSGLRAPPVQNSWFFFRNHEMKLIRTGW